MSENNGNKLKNFTPAYDILLAKYGPVAAVVYGYIWRRSQGERKRCDSNRKTIKLLLHIDEKTFTTHARKLAEGGYVDYRERGNSSTIYWPTGKAEKENAVFSVENFPTKRDGSEEILPDAVENFLAARENLPGSEENFPSQQGNFPYDDTLKDTIEETKKESNDDGLAPETANQTHKKNPSSSVTLYFSKLHEEIGKGNYDGLDYNNELVLAETLGLYQIDKNRHLVGCITYPTVNLRKKYLEAAKRLFGTPGELDKALKTIAESTSDLKRIIDYVAKWTPRTVDAPSTIFDEADKAQKQRERQGSPSGQQRRSILERIRSEEAQKLANHDYSIWYFATTNLAQLKPGDRYYEANVQDLEKIGLTLEQAINMTEARARAYCWNRHSSDKFSEIY